MIILCGDGMSVPEQIIMQEGDVNMYQSSPPTSPEEASKVIVEGIARGYQVGHLVLTNRNLYFVVTGFAEGFLASELAARTPFGIGRRLISRKTLSLQDVYRYLSNPGSLTIPLNSVRLVEYRKYPLSGAEITIGCELEQGFRLYTFRFRGISDKTNWKNAIESWVISNGGTTVAKPPYGEGLPCPDCNTPMVWIPYAYKYYCPNCRSFK